MAREDADLVAAAQAALALVQSSPSQAATVAAEVRDRALSDDVPVAASVAERALGLAVAHLGHLGDAERHLEQAVRHAVAADAAETAGEARMTLAGVLNRRGRSARALAEIDQAVESLGALARARALTQRGAIRQELGQLEPALADYRSAWPVLVRADDAVWMQRLLLNRGVLHSFRHAYATAARDLERAAELVDRLGLRLPQGFVAENLVLVYRRLGDVPAALAQLDRAERIYRELGTPVGTLMIERGELLLSVRLMAEAREAAAAAVSEYERTDRRLGLAEARLLLARTVLASDPVLAGRQAREAARELSRQNRPGWAVLARYTATVSALRTPGGRVGTAQLVALADALQQAGWGTTVDDARLLAGTQGLRSRSPVTVATARSQLALVAGRRSRGPAERRLRGWLATATLAEDAGDGRRASAAAAAGLRVIADHRASMAATDLRARVAAHGTVLAELGLRHALAGGDPWSVLRWAERARSRHLADRPAVPVEDPALADLLARLRAVVQERTDRQRETGDASAGGPAAVADLDRRQLELETAIRDQSRRGTTDPTVQVRDRERSVEPDRSGLHDALGDAALVELVQCDGELAAVLLADGRASLHRLGPVDPVAGQVSWLPFALRRLARSGLDDRSRDAARALIASAAQKVDTALLGPLRLADRPLVLVPTGVLQTVPWAVLPRLKGRPVTVSPTAGLWLAAARRAPRTGAVTAAAGPGLPGADREVEGVAELWGVEALTGARAAVAAVSERLGSGGLAHLAAHGSIRADNPQFSALTFADGPLTVYDIERLPRGPDTVVLAACEAGRSVVLAGDELLGLASSFVGRDTRHLIASSVPLPDLETEAMMLALHRRLAAGEAVAGALAATQAAIDPTDVRLWAAAAGFVSFGAGFSPVAVTPTRR